MLQQNKMIFKEFAQQSKKFVQRITQGQNFIHVELSESPCMASLDLLQLANQVL